MIDLTILRLVLGALTAWLDCREREAIAYLIEETGFCGASFADVGCVSPTTIAVAWLRARTWSAVQPCSR